MRTTGAWHFSERKKVCLRGEFYVGGIIGINSTVPRFFLQVGSGEFHAEYQSRNESELEGHIRWRVRASVEGHLIEVG